MLTLTHIRTIQDALKLLSEDERTALAASPVEAQHATFKGIYEKAGIESPEVLAGAFLVFYRTIARDLTKPNTPEHTALRAAYCPATTKWHVDNPPTDAIQLLDPDFNAAWLIDAAPKIGANLDFAEVKMSDKIACVARNFFGLGGYEDLNDASAIQNTNPTMKLLIELVVRRLPAVQPQWYRKDEKSGAMVLRDKVDDTRPLAVLKAIAEAELKAQKAKDRAEKAAKAREEARAKWQAEKVQKVTELASQPGLVDVLYKEADRIVALGFNAAAAMFAADSVYEAPDAMRAAAAAMASAPTVENAEARDALFTTYLRVAREAVLMSIHERKPNWLDTNADGDLKFRRSETAVAATTTEAIKEPGHFTRKGGAILRAFYGVVEQYGSDDVVAVLKAQLQGKENRGLDAKIFDDLFAALEFKPTPEGLFRKEKAAAGEPETLKV